MRSRRSGRVSCELSAISFQLRLRPVLGFGMGGGRGQMDAQQQVSFGFAQGRLSLRSEGQRFHKANSFLLKKVLWLRRQRIPR
jgi:hypothetical protein